MKVEDLFPVCYRSDCGNKKPGHKHVLPMQREILDSKERFLALVGGYGSGKTLPACILGHLLSIAVPGNMGIVLRRSLPKLHDSTERIYLEVLKRSGVNYIQREMRDGWPHRIIYPNGSEVTFRETKDLGRFLGPEYGWFYVDEAQEEPKKTFTDLIGRLRLPRARKYLKGILATNPPSRQHWIAELWPKPGSFSRTVTLKTGKQVTNTYRMIQSSTYDNPFLAEDYIAGILQNNTPAEAKKIIEGFYGFSAEGKPVYPQFDYVRHVADLHYYKNQTLYRTWDFGFHCPACIWLQVFRCKFSSVHENVLQEIMGKDVEAVDFADQVLVLHDKTFPEHPKFLVMDGGDAAGAQVSDKGPGPIIRLGKPYSEGGRNIRFTYRKFPDIDPGLELVRKQLRTRCKCGFPLLMIDRRCTNLIEAVVGGYHYPKEVPGKDNAKKPVKDGFYDNIADTLRYGALLFYVPAENGVDLIPDAGLDVLPQDSTPWSWMERMV